MSEEKITPVEVEGELMRNLTLSNVDIKRSRAESIYDDLETVYRRNIEDLRAANKRLERDRTNMLDFGGDKTTDLRLAKSLDPKEFYETDLKISLSIRENNIRLEEATARYINLFGTIKF